MAQKMLENMLAQFQSDLGWPISIPSHPTLGLPLRYRSAASFLAMYFWACSASYSPSAGRGPPSSLSWFSFPIRSPVAASPSWCILAGATLSIDITSWIILISTVSTYSSAMMTRYVMAFNETNFLYGSFAAVLAPCTFIASGLFVYTESPTKIQKVDVRWCANLHSQINPCEHSEPVFQKNNEPSSSPYLRQRVEYIDDFKF